MPTAFFFGGGSHRLRDWHALASFTAGLLLGMAPLAAQACATCGCTLSADWAAQGLSSGSGWLVDVRDTNIDQNQLRSGTSTIGRATAASRVVNGQPQEVETDTRSNYLYVSVDYSPSYNWGVNVSMPWVNRRHSTLGTGSDGSFAAPDGGAYRSSTSSAGDLRVVGRYQGLSSEHNVGLLFGVKLPTGSYSKTALLDDASDSVAIDRSLQPGTGTTDAILGGYLLGEWGETFDWFSQVVVQTAFNSRAGYRPGTTADLNWGTRYLRFEWITPQLQMNLRHQARDAGEQADTINTGGTLLYLSPGVTVPISKVASIYGFLQLPLYQNLNGVQLTPKFTATAGVRMAF